jgi:hypothetical protein
MQKTLKIYVMTDNTQTNHLNIDEAFKRLAKHVVREYRMIARGPFTTPSVVRQSAAADDQEAMMRLYDESRDALHLCTGILADEDEHITERLLQLFSDENIPCAYVDCSTVETRQEAVQFFTEKVFKMQSGVIIIDKFTEVSEFTDRETIENILIHPWKNCPTDICGWLLNNSRFMVLIVGRKNYGSIPKWYSCNGYSWIGDPVEFYQK